MIVALPSVPAWAAVLLGVLAMLGNWFPIACPDCCVKQNVCDGNGTVDCTPTCESCPETFTLTVAGVGSLLGGCSAFSGPFTLTRDPVMSTSCIWKDNTFSPTWTLMCIGTLGAFTSVWRLESASGFVVFRCKRTGTCPSFVEFVLHSNSCGGNPAALLAA